MEKILVINNEMDTMHLLKNWLEKKTYQVEYTSNAGEAPALVKKLQPSLIIVDIMQKDVLQTIKQDKEISDIPVLLMTGYTSRHRGKDVPCDDIIEKPFNLPLLEKKIANLITHNMVS